MTMPRLGQTCRVYKPGKPYMYGTLTQWVDNTYCIVEWDKRGSQMIARDQLYLLKDKPQT